jgi:hypothetical protein
VQGNKSMKLLGKFWTVLFIDLVLYFGSHIARSYTAGFIFWGQMSKQSTEKIPHMLEELESSFLQFTYSHKGTFLSV